MKKLIPLLVLIFSAAAARADNLDMVTVTPDDVAAFVRLDVKQDATMSKVLLGSSGNTAAVNLTQNSGNVTVQLLQAGNSVSAAGANVTMSYPVMFFAYMNAGSLIVQGNIGAGQPVTSVSRVFINGVELDNNIPIYTVKPLGWRENSSINLPVISNPTNVTGVHVLCTAPSAAI